LLISIVKDYRKYPFLRRAIRSNTMKLTIEVLAENGLTDQVKIMVGGAPVTQKFPDEIGADGYAQTRVQQSN